MKVALLGVVWRVEFRWDAKTKLFNLFISFLAFRV